MAPVVRGLEHPVLAVTAILQGVCPAMRTTTYVYPAASWEALAGQAAIRLRRAYIAREEAETR
jgi:hypothetical protein